jgi:broad specificity phosphatase PhoE
MGIFSSKPNNSYNQSNEIKSNKSLEYNQKFKQLLNNINKNEQIDNQDKQIIKQELQKLKNTYNQQTEYDFKIKGLTEKKTNLVEEKGMRVRNKSRYENNFQQILQNINKKLSPKSQKYIKDELLKMKKFNKNKNISYNKKLISITKKKNQLTNNLLNTINVNIYWVRHGFSCANLQKYKGILLKQKNPNLTDLGCYGLLAQQLNLTNSNSISNRIQNRIPIPRESGSAAGGASTISSNQNTTNISSEQNTINLLSKQELQILKDKLQNKQIDLFGASQLLRAIETQAILFAPFNNKNEIEVLPYISEKRETIALGMNKDNEPENQDITNIKFKNSLKYFISKKYLSENKIYNLSYDYDNNVYKKPDLDKFYNETLPKIIKKLKENNPNNNEFNLIIVSHQNFMKNIIKNYKLIDIQQTQFDEKNTKLPNQSILLQKLKLSNNNFKQNNIQQEKLILLSPSNFDVPMPYFVPKSTLPNTLYTSNKNFEKYKYTNSQKVLYYYILNNILDNFSKFGSVPCKKNLGERRIQNIFSSIIKNNNALLNKMSNLSINSYDDFRNYLKKNDGKNLDKIIKNKYDLIMKINEKLSDFNQNPNFLIFENNPNVIDFEKQIKEIIKLTESSPKLFNILFCACTNDGINNNFRKQILKK